MVQKAQRDARELQRTLRLLWLTGTGRCKQCHVRPVAGNPSAALTASQWWKGMEKEEKRAVDE